MSDDEQFSDRDEQVVALLDEQVDSGGSAGADTDSEIDALRAENRDLRERVETLEAKVNRMGDVIAERLDRLESDTTTVADDATLLERYAHFDADEREAELSASERLALMIHEQWDEIGWTLGGGRNFAGTRETSVVGVDTKTTANAKFNPSKLKHRLEVRAGRNLQAIQIYRALERLAELSGGEKIIDENGRTQVLGGTYHYNERATVDGNDKKRVLWKPD